MIQRRVGAWGMLAAGLVSCAVASADPTGLWRTEDGSGHVEIAPCGEHFCGTLVWLKDPLDVKGAPVRDIHNPDVALRDRPVLGLTIVSGLAPTRRSNLWDRGSVYDPQSGNTYRARVTLTDPQKLELRGYVGTPLLGRTSTWTRVRANTGDSAE